MGAFFPLLTPFLSCTARMDSSFDVDSFGGKGTAGVFLVIPLMLFVGMAPLWVQLQLSAISDLPSAACLTVKRHEPLGTIPAITIPWFSD